VDVEAGIWFIGFEKTWVALRPINLGAFERRDHTGRRAEQYPAETNLVAPMTGAGLAGFAMEVGEPPLHGDLAAFKQAVKERNKLDLAAVADRSVTLTSSTGKVLRLVHNAHSELPRVFRDGTEYVWDEHRDVYQPEGGTVPLTLGWHGGTLKVEAGGRVFEKTVAADGKVEFRCAPAAP
jgi:hypothetical protein